MPQFRFVSLLILLICSTDHQSQNTNVRDSLARRLRTDSAEIFRNTIARPYLRLENRRSFIESEKANFLGFLAGAVLHDRHIVCAGFYFLEKNSRGLIKLNKEGTLQQQFSHLNYYVFSYQYILLNHRFVQLNTPLEAGYGDYKASLYDQNAGISEQQLSGNFVPLCAGLQLILKPVKWAGVSASGGYRYVKHDAIRLSFNGWYYSFGVWADARYLFRSLRYKLAERAYRKAVSALTSASQ